MAVTAHSGRERHTESLHRLLTRDFSLFQFASSLKEIFDRKVMIFFGFLIGRRDRLALIKNSGASCVYPIWNRIHNIDTSIMPIFFRIPFRHHTPSHSIFWKMGNLVLYKTFRLLAKIWNFWVSEKNFHTWSSIMNTQSDILWKSTESFQFHVFFLNIPIRLKNSPSYGVSVLEIGFFIRDIQE